MSIRVNLCQSRRRFCPPANLRIDCTKKCIRLTRKRNNEKCQWTGSCIFHDSLRMVDVVRQTLSLPPICCCCLVDWIRIKYICILMMTASAITRMTNEKKTPLFGINFSSRNIQSSLSELIFNETLTMWRNYVLIVAQRILSINQLSILVGSTLCYASYFMDPAEHKNRGYKREKFFLNSFRNFKES